MSRLPDDLFARTDGPRFAPSGARGLQLLGRTVEVLWLPERSRRRGVPKPDRPPFHDDAAPTIVAREAVWHGGDLAVTPNRYPFANRQLVLWSTRPIREPDEEMLAAALAFTSATGATALMNSIGAAASIPRAHLHLVDERLPFLPGLPTVAVTADWTGTAAARVARVPPPFPTCLLAIRGAPAARARALHRLLLLRTATAFNAVDDGDTAWLMPRSPTELTAPWFPQALGAAELWGRWCFLDEAPFRRADADGLLAALTLAGIADRGAG